MLKTIRHILEMIRFSHTLFALPFALLAAVMAWMLPEMIIEESLLPPPRFTFRALVGLLLCMVFARSFAMSVNRLVDRKLDLENPRTAGRHLPAGILTVTQVFVFAVVCAALFVVSTLLFFPNPLPLFLSLPVLAFLAGYSYAKRFTASAHLWLGAALGLAPVAAWIAIRGVYVTEHPDDLWPAIVLGGLVITWVTGFDIIYSCQDVETDLRLRLHSLPAELGVAGALQAATACHVGTICLLLILPTTYPYFGWIYWAGVAAVAVLLVYEHLLVRPDDLSRVNAAFFNVNAVISLGLFAVGTIDLLVGHG